ncbi:GNAT family N-acetyltransferase [Enterococcus casseliflavus]|uniref:GNAT family N-acetyltransferase n=1 Tax=Enterococcus casseliflavus TaxID=37734 RepID=UPI0003543E6B|nr:GNAT family N-acetyltransferase [Enterococcus casseliflavus]EPH60455.1 acetyltransferase, GNAT family [Enterococcus casseliflavus 14-MB-W-14]MBZ3642091.1 GNAT family N-acetyltransferase [Enterococcus casseliflavus]MDB1695829.1 GNAT family N-acetyltransferase [Enterococcus casseliflavus]MDB1699262.1 GNAT family N-acetyltransferase [Enterococcus casseliflavus]MDB1702575.1 GNAT family N-acetyltransferase [Enterococcus casseliflavus]
MTDVKKMTEFGSQEVLELVSYAFQWELNETNIKRYRKLAENSWNYGSYDEDGKLASQIMATIFDVNFHGTTYPMAGIGFVASYPEYRSQGRIDRIMKQIIKDCYEQKIVLSYLAPFSFAFYRRYGYEYTFERTVYEVDAHQWPDGKKVNGRIQRMNWEEAQPIIHEIYHQLPRHQKGGLIRQAWWEEIKFVLRRPYTFAIYRNEAGVPEGYLIYFVEGGRFDIQEWGYLTADAYQGFNRFIVSHADSVAQIHYRPGFDGEVVQVNAAKPLAHYQVRPDMMARVVDVEGFLTSYPFTLEKAGRFAIEIQGDEYAPWNNGCYEVTIENAQHHVTKTTATQLPKATLSIQRFVQLFLQAQSLDSLVFFQQMETEKEAAVMIQENLPDGKPILEDYF